MRLRRTVALVACAAVAAVALGVQRPAHAAAPDILGGVWAVDGLDGVVLEWFAPLSGDPPTGYEYATSTDGGTTFSSFTAVPPTISTSNGSRTRITTTVSASLVRGTETIFQVRAVTPMGPVTRFPSPTPPTGRHGRCVRPPRSATRAIRSTTATSATSAPVGE